MNQDKLGASSRIGRLREKFFDGLTERVGKAQHDYDALKANAADRHAAEGLKTVFHNLKGVASVFGFADLGILSARGEELIGTLLNTPAGQEAQIPAELDAYMEEFKRAIQAALDAPREDPAPAVRPDEESASQEPGHGSKRAAGTTGIVIADDDALTRSVLRAMLHDGDYQVLGEASNGESALEQCDKLRPDLLLLDINMPGTDGLSVLKSVRRQFPAIKVIMVSAEASMDKVSSAITAGAAGFVVKPFNEATVLKQIGRYFKGKSNR